MDCRERRISAEPAALELLAKYAEVECEMLFPFLNNCLLSPSRRNWFEKVWGSPIIRSEELYSAWAVPIRRKVWVLSTVCIKKVMTCSNSPLLLGLLRVKLHSAVSERKQNVIPKLLHWANFDDAWMSSKGQYCDFAFEMAIIRATHHEEGIAEKNGSERTLLLQ